MKIVALMECYSKGESIEGGALKNWANFSAPIEPKPETRGDGSGPVTPYEGRYSGNTLNIMDLDAESYAQLVVGKKYTVTVEE